jgi:T5SS/PEP-CTERM-associated repeat protein
MVGQEARAVGSSWTGNTSTDWFTASNWVGGVPTSSSIVTIDQTTNQPVINGGNIHVSKLVLGFGGNNDVVTVTMEGGQIFNSGGLEIAKSPGTTGTVDVTGGNSSWNPGVIIVGEAGNGTLVISNGAVVNATLFTGVVPPGSMVNAYGTDIGYGAIGNLSAMGNLTVTGLGSALSLSGNAAGVAVGNLEGGNGVLNIINGGQVTNGPAMLGNSTGSSGTALISGVGSGWTATQLQVGNFGAGNLTVASGGVVNVAQGVVVAQNAGSTGVVNLNGGTLQAGSTIQVNGNGTLAGTGQLNGSVIINSDGVLAPGTAGPLLVGAGNVALGGTGNVTLGGAANFEFADATHYSQLELLGSGAVLSYGGNLTLDFDVVVSSFGTDNLFSFANGNETGDFANVDLGGVYSGALSDSGGIWTGIAGNVAFTFNTATGDLTTAVPEPGEWGAVIGMVALVAAGVRWVKRK